MGARFLSAQSQVSVPQVSSTDPATAAFRAMEIFSRSVRQAHEEKARQIAEKQAEQLARLQFREKANKFVALWEDFVSRLNEKQTFDVKLAKKVAKAFHELESSDGWPVRAVAGVSENEH